MKPRLFLSVFFLFGMIVSFYFGRNQLAYLFSALTFICFIAALIEAAKIWKAKRDAEELALKEDFERFVKSNRRKVIFPDSPTTEYEHFKN